MPLRNIDHPIFSYFPDRERSIKKLMAENLDFCEVCEDYKTVLDEITTETLPEENISQPVLNELLRLKSNLEADIQTWLENIS